MGALTSLATVGLNAALTQRAARNDRRELTQERDRQIAEIRTRDAEWERERQATLQRLLAAQRARAGAAGIGGSGGSAEAVLRGLTEESEQARAARQSDSARRIEELRERTRRQRRSNLLDLSSTLTRTGFGLLGPGRTTRRSLLDL